MKKFLSLVLALYLFWISPQTAFAADPLRAATDRSVSNVSTTPSVLMQSNPAREFVAIQNVNASGTYIGVSIGSTVPSVSSAGVGGAGTYVLASGQSLILSSGDGNTTPPTNVINVVASAGSTEVVTAWER